MRYRQDETGTITVLVVGLTVALLAIGGLVFDGGRLLAARREAFAVADNAARAGAQAVDRDVLRAGGAVLLDPPDAERAALAYLQQTGHEGVVTVLGDRVRVEVTRSVPLVLLPIVGMEARTVTGTGEARVVRGITQAGG